MMKKIFTTAIALVLCMGAFAQGINFRDISLKEALEQSAAEKKPVFLDCYTTWCGPCKYMSEEVFVLKEAGDYFNPRFVSLKIDMEKGEGVEIAKKYAIRAYPTFLVLNSDGTVRHTVVGGGEIKDFITRVEAGLDMKKPMSALEEEYNNGTIGKNDLALYWTLVKAQGSAGREKRAEIEDKLFGMLSKKDKLSDQYWTLLQARANTPDSEGFAFILDNRKALEKKQGKENVNGIVYRVFEQYLTQMAAGRNAKDRAALPAIMGQIDATSMSNKETIYALAELAAARADKDFDAFVSAYEKNYKSIPEVNRSNILASAGSLAAGEDGKQKYARLARMLNGTADGWNDARMKDFSLNIAKGFERMSKTGVYWEEFDSLEDALAQARKENKPVFLDCYTTWCGPCQQMANVVFPQEEVGDFFNARFINVKIDMEEGEGPEIGKRFGVRAYPTFVVIAPDGTMRHTIVGGGDGPGFIERVKEAFDDKKALGAQQAKYDKGERGTEFLLAYLEALNNAYSPKAAEVSQSIFESLTDDQRVSREYWMLFEDPEISSPGSETEKYLLANIDRFRTSIGREEVDKRISAPYGQKIMMIIAGRDDKSTAADIDQLVKEIKAYGLEEAPTYTYTALADMAKLRIKGDLNVKNYKKAGARLKAEELPYLYLFPSIKGNMTPAQVEQWKAWGREIADASTDPRYKQYMEQFLAQ